MTLNQRAFTDLAGQPRQPDYIERNRRWITPLFAIMIVTAVPLVLDVMQMPTDAGDKDHAGSNWMTTLAHVGLVLGAFCAGLGASLTETVSAKIVSILLPGIGVALLTAFVVTSMTPILAVMFTAWLLQLVLRSRKRAV